jgi:hypothetical protein
MERGEKTGMWRGAAVAAYACELTNDSLNGFCLCTIIIYSHILFSGLWFNPVSLPQYICVENKMLIKHETVISGVEKMQLGSREDP